MHNFKLLFTKDGNHIQLKNIRYMKKHINDNWHIQEAFLSDTDVLGASSIHDLLKLQTKRASNKKHVHKMDKLLHKRLMRSLKAIVSKAIETDILQNEELSQDIRHYMHDLYLFLKENENDTI